MKCGTTPHNDALFTLKFSLIHNPSKVKMYIKNILKNNILPISLSSDSTVDSSSCLDKSHAIIMIFP